MTLRNIDPVLVRFVFISMPDVIPVLCNQEFHPDPTGLPKKVEGRFPKRESFSGASH